MKRCTICGIEYPETKEFFRPVNELRLRAQCRQCEREKYKVWQEAHKDERNEYWRKYHEEHREKERAYARNWRNNHLERARDNEHHWRKVNPKRKLEHQRKYVNRHPDRPRAYHRKWTKNNPGKVKAKADQYRAKKKAGGKYTDEDVKRLYDAQKGKCYWCGQKVGKDFTIDHVIPLNRGGSNTPENIVIACRHCNCSRQDKLPHEWQGNNGKLM